MDADEIEFIGEKEEIGIIPNFNFQALHLISNSLGPFRAGLPMHVPLWLAIHLKRQQKCRIVPPTWMDREFLEELKETEKRETRFVKMPSEHYMVISKLIFTNASDDVPYVDEIKTLIKDIYDIRLSKLRAAVSNQVDQGANEGSSAATVVSYTNLTIQEVNTVKPFLPFAADLVARLERTHLQHVSNLNNSTRLSNF